MEPRLTFLGRSAQRWRVRVELPECACLRGLTVGLWGPDGRPLAPGVVLPVARGAGPSVHEAELGGPAELPAGAEVRCLVDIDGEALPLVTCLGVDRRKGLAAWLHGDARLHVQAGAPPVAALDAREVGALARAWPGIVGDVEIKGASAGEDRVYGERRRGTTASEDTRGGAESGASTRTPPGSAGAGNAERERAPGGDDALGAARGVSGSSDTAIRPDDEGQSRCGDRRSASQEAHAYERAGTDDLLSMLRDDFGVDVDDLDESLRGALADEP